MRPDEVTVRDLLERDMAEVRRGIDDLRTLHTEGLAASSREHDAVRADIRELRGKLDGVATKEEFSTFKHEVYDRFGLLEQDLHERTGGRRSLSAAWAFVLGCAALAGPLLALITHLSH